MAADPSSLSIEQPMLRCHAAAEVARLREKTPHPGLWLDRSSLSVEEMIDNRILSDL
jgi:hypothetical protein